MGRNRSIGIVGIIVLLFGLLSTLVIMQSSPPAFHSIAGTIYNDSGIIQVPLGTPFSINDSDSGDYLRSKTQHPAPPWPGRYAESINGSDGDFVIVYAWNRTHYGTTNFSLLGDMTDIDIYINLTRTGETNLTFLSPANDTEVNLTYSFNVTANITMLGANSLSCSATISFENNSVFEIAGTDQIAHNIGNINRAQSNFTTWNVTAKAIGSSDIYATAVCQDHSLNLEKQTDDTLGNITVIDRTKPIVRLVTPLDSAISGKSNITFIYNVTDFSNISMCQFVLNNDVNLTNSTTIQKNVPQNFTQFLPDAAYTWNVNCTDAAGNNASATQFDLTVLTAGPAITNHVTTSPISLIPGATAFVECNVTATPVTEEKNVSLVNATFFDPVVSFASDTDDNNYHYTNGSCANTTYTGGEENYSCGFEFWYYANNASWTCQIIATDTDNGTSTAQSSTLVNELLALNNTLTLDYGDLQPTNTSRDENLTVFNIGNVPINVTARGYGVVDGDNLSMTCGIDGNITVGDQRHFSYFDTNYGLMTPLTNMSSQILNLSLMQRTDDTGHTNDFNLSFWKVRIPTGIGGLCNGTIVLTAIAANFT